MTEQEQKILRDLVGYIELSMADDSSAEFTHVIFNVAHDAVGITRKDPLFSPRTTGYARLFSASVKSKGERS